MLGSSVADRRETATLESWRSVKNPVLNNPTAHEKLVAFKTTCRLPRNDDYFARNPRNRREIIALVAIERGLPPAAGRPPRAASTLPVPAQRP